MRIAHSRKATNTKLMDSAKESCDRSRKAVVDLRHSLMLGARVGVEARLARKIRRELTAQGIYHHEEARP